MVKISMPLFDSLAKSLPEIIPATRLSRLLGGLYTTKYLANLRFMGTGPRFFKIRGRVFYRREDVLEWLRASTTDPSESQLPYNSKPEVSQRQQNKRYQPAI